MSDRVATADIGRKICLALEVLNYSRVRCARELGVHKSMVARWVTGKAHPTEHNLTRLTELVHRARLDFVLSFWELDAAVFVRRLNIALPTDETRAADRPTIAVLALDNLSSDPGQDYFSDGVAENIITELSRSRSLVVIARNSSLIYRGRAVDVRQIERELGVRYVLEGSVRRVDNRIRISAQLIDAQMGSYIWAER
jgi:adenylate cyclase